MTPVLLIPIAVCLVWAFYSRDWRGTLFLVGIMLLMLLAVGEP